MVSAGPSLPNFNASSYAIFDSSLPPVDAGCYLRLDQSSNQIYRYRKNQSDGPIGSWGNGSLTIGDYDFRIDTITGSPNYSGTQAADTWINGFNLMYWGVEETGIGISSFTGTLRVRPAGGGADIDTAGYSAFAEATP